MLAPEQILEALAGSVALVDREGNVVASNASWRAGRGPLARAFEEVSDLRKAALSAVAERPDGARWWAELDAVRDASQEECHLYIGAASDPTVEHITARRWPDGELLLVQGVECAHPGVRPELHDRLAELEVVRQRLELALEGSRDGFWDLDVQSGRIFMSARVAQIYDLDPTEMSPDVRWHRARHHPDEVDELTDRWVAALKGLSSYYFAEHRVQSQTGEWLWVATRGKVVERDADGRAVRFVGIISDISERRQLEEQLAQSQKMDSIGRLAGGIAHDFNNLITGVLGYAELLRARLQNDPRAVYVDEIVKAANRAGNLTAQLLEFARRRVVEPRVLDVNHTVHDLAPMLRRLIGENVELDVQLGVKMRAVRIDPAQFEQILVNLAVNARDAMPDGGRVTVATSNVYLDREYVRQNPDASEGAHVVLVVTDTGIGMDEDTKWRIFEPFFTTKPRGKGTGLGLSTCYGIIAQAGGHIRVFSEEGAGASFRIYLPSVAEQPGVARPMSAEQAVVSGGHETLLLAEDEDVVRLVVEETLRDQGYEVLSAADGREAVEIIDAHDGPIDLVLTDLVMPHVNGRQVAEHVRSARPGTPVLLMSGYVEDVVSPDQDDGGFVLSKPFSTATMLEHVRRLLDERRSEQAS